ncbi:Crp/Fnr family transcriptional regulator [Primorskyibacter sp. S187A]|uniref:Crp/Fnr family transcriptional regulator n=1 Tax=Primorskyibacter sp. S187A TaxID=3415130 RepID=UPI003C7E3C1B
MRSPIFRNLKQQDVEHLLERSVLRPLDRGASIYLQGESAHSMFIILDGWIKTYRLSSCGSEAVVGIFSKAGCFGEETALRNANYTTGAEAVTDALVAQLDGCVLQKAIDEDLNLCLALLKGAMRQRNDLITHVEQLKSHTAAQRIADFLLTLCPDNSSTCTVVLPYDKVLIAAWLGMKPESLSRAFRRLKGHGVTIRKNHAVIESVEELSHYAEEDPAEAWSARL